MRFTSAPAALALPYAVLMFMQLLIPPGLPPRLPGTKRIGWRGAGWVWLSLLLVLHGALPAWSQPLTGRANVEVTVQIPAEELMASMARQQAQLDEARTEREALRQAVAQLAPPPAIPDPPTPPASIGGFTPLVKSRDTRVVYVAADGNDRNHGRTPDAPMRTPRAAYQRLGDGRADWLLFKAGDVFTDPIGELTKSGRSADEPFVLGVYGPPEDGRPVFLVDGESWISSSFRNDLRHVVIQGLEAVAVERDPGRPGFDPATLGEAWKQGGIGLLGDDSDILIEDCVLRCFSVAVVLQSGLDHGPMRNIRLNRNIIVDSYNHHDGDIGGHSQGLYAQEVDGLLLEANIFDHNGWCGEVEGAQRTKFNHNLYIQTDCRNVAVRDNLITRGASHGLQLRPGGEVSGNLFARNALAFFVGWHHSTVLSNVVLQTDDIGPQEPRGLGLEVMPCYQATVAENIFSSKRGTAEHAAAIDVKWDPQYLERMAGADFNVTLLNNKVHDWPVYGGREPTIRINEAAKVMANRGNAVDDPAWRDPDRDVGRYMASLALEPSFEAFMDQARARPRGQWDERFAAGAVLAYIRGGFVVD